ncbi:MAG: hypothetical protein HRT90_07360 [Candidatus Margulisbacteria bacterium]|nr:hypothetical protein [Candidatus Margulisiibacteriota bacterium]
MVEEYKKSAGVRSKIVLCIKLTKGLKEIGVKVTKEEENADEAIPEVEE